MNWFRPWFAEPLGLALLSLLPMLLALAAWALGRRRKALVRLGGWSALMALASVRRGRRWLAAAAGLGGLTFLILGTAGPQWGRDPDLSRARGRDVVLILDMSRSMLAQDVLGSASPDRLGRARDAILDLLDTVRKRGGHRFALVVFAARAQTVCPLTHDYDHLRETLGKLDLAEPFLDIGPTPSSISGTRVGEALRLAVQLQDPRFRGQQDIVLLSDGDDPVSDVEWRRGAILARAQAIAVHTVGIGDPDKDSPIPVGGGVLLHEGRPVQTRLHEEPLEEIAQLTGGVYTPARTRAIPLGELFRQRIEPLGGHDDAGDPLPAYRLRYPWFFAAALVLWAVEMVLGEGFRRRPSKDDRGATGETPDGGRP
jgi:Ca-activated chloride channel family protein